MNQQTNSGAGDLVSGEIKHTKTPYGYDPSYDNRKIYKDIGDKRYVVAMLADWAEDTEHTGRFIVRACNRDHAFDGLVSALQMAKHIVAAEGTAEQLNQVFAALELAGIQP